MNVYVFAGSKKNPNWYYTACKLSMPYFGFDKQAKKFYCNFIALHRNHIGGFCILALRQIIVLPFLHRLYFSEELAKKRQHRNWELKEREKIVFLDELDKERREEK